MLHRRTLGMAAAALLAIASMGQAAAPGPARSVDPMVQRRTAVVDVYEKARDSVVNISATRIIEDRSPMGMGGSLFDQLFDLPGRRGAQPRTRRGTSLGSGFVIHPDGYVVTNAHVVARTVERKVSFSDDREYDAQIVAIDDRHDLALLKIQSDETFKPLRMGSSDDLMIGETVIAIGNPMGYQSTVTAGVVSAVDREIAIDRDHVFSGLIQTDASINPGNSGGPLLNVLGELVGVNSAIRGDAQNIGFAIAVDQVRTVLPEMIDVERRYRIKAGLLVMPGPRPKVVSIEVDSPADKAGVHVGDQLVGVDADIVHSGIDYHIAMIGRKADEKVKLKLVRDGEEIDVVLTLAERPRPDGGKLMTSLFGLELEAITPEMARDAGLPRLRGLLIKSVADDSDAARIGLRRGDVIDALGRYAVADLDAAGVLLEPVAKGDKVPLRILRITRGSLIRQTVVLTAQ